MVALRFEKIILLYYWSKKQERFLYSALLANVHYQKLHKNMNFHVWPPVGG